MIDENAFGILISYFSVEDDEYSLEREDFVARFQKFREIVYDYLAEISPAREARALDLGHAVFIEFAEGQELVDLIGWTRGLRARLSGADLANALVITHGSRWIDEDDSTFDALRERFVADVAVRTVSNPSEPLRRALSAEVATHGAPDARTEGWGPGLYVDTEALDALDRTPKNAPTVLEVAGATFFRAGS